MVVLLRFINSKIVFCVRLVLRIQRRVQTSEPVYILTSLGPVIIRDCFFRLLIIWVEHKLAVASKNVSKKAELDHRESEKRRYTVVY